MDSFARDLRFALRAFRRSRGFLVFAVVLLGTGLGGAATIWAVIDAVLLRPLPYANAERLMAVSGLNPQAGTQATAISWTRYELLRDAPESPFEAIAVTAGDGYSLTGEGEASNLGVLRVTGPFFEILGLAPVRGRFFTQEDFTSEAPVIVLTEPFWRDRFGGEESLVGRTIRLNGVPTTVIGIAPPSLGFPFLGLQGIVPRAHHPTYIPREVAENRAIFLQGIALRKEGVSDEALEAGLDLLTSRYRQAFPERLDSAHATTAIPFLEPFVGGARPQLVMLAAAVALVLLIACANVSNLLLVRHLGRRREIAVQQAIGATPATLVRQTLLEGLVIATLAAGMGLLAAAWCTRIVRAQLEPVMPRTDGIALDLRVVLVTLVVALLTGLLMSVWPALQSRVQSVSTVLKEEGGRGPAGSGSSWMRSLLVVAEVAFSVILLVAAALVGASFLKLIRVPLGFDAERVIVGGIALPPDRYPDVAAQSAFRESLIERLSAHGLVERASAAFGVPFSGQFLRTPMQIEGREPLPIQDRPVSQLGFAHPGYFQAMGIELLRGRDFTPEDKLGSPRVIIVTETWARTFLPGEDPMGKVILTGANGENRNEVVGLVRDHRPNGIQAGPADIMYLPSKVQGPTFHQVVVKGRQDTAGAIGAATEVLRELDPDIPLTLAQPLEDAVRQALAPQRLTLGVLACFSALALALASVGLYGVIAASVAQRTGEIGIRMALGATETRIFRMIVREGGLLVGIGIIAGLAGAAGLSRFMQATLFEVQALDPWIYLGVAFGFSVVGLTASVIPALRAARIDPLEALRR